MALRLLVGPFHALAGGCLCHQRLICLLAWRSLLLAGGECPSGGLCCHSGMAAGLRLSNRLLREETVVSDTDLAFVTASEHR